MPRTKGADLITDYLIANKIPYVFGICGHGNVGMLDSLHAARDRIKLVSPRHEQVAAHMADAYFRVRHEPVATLTSCGPGSCNIVMPLACAIADSSALLAITANVPTSQFNRSPFQEINKHFQADFPNIIRPVVKRSFQPTRVDMLPLALRQAMTTMLSGRPGPVNLDVPFNVFQEEDDVELPPPAPPLNAQRSGASPDEISACVDLILKAERPVIFIGHGVTLSEASARADRIRPQLGIPVISSPNGMGCLDMTDPLSLGFIGRNGAYPANEAGRRADVVIAIGARFDDRSASSWLPGYSWNFPQTQTDPCRRRSGRARAQLSARYRRAGRRAHVPAAAARRDSNGASPSATRSKPGMPTSKNGRPNGRSSRGRISTFTPRRSGPSASSPIARTCCRRTRSCAATSASATIGTCSSGRRAARRP